MNRMKDFAPKVRKSLIAQGIEIYGATWLPDSTGDCCNGETGYLLNDNGTSRVRTYSQVLQIAGEAK